MTVVTNDGLLVLAERLGVQTLPLVLSIGPQQDSFDEWTVAQRRAATALTGAGVIDGHGEVDPDLAATLHTLSQPDRELVARVFTAGARPVRICLARRGEQCALAVRTEDDVDITSVWADEPAAALMRPVFDALGACPPAEVANFSALSDDLAERLDAAKTSADYADAVYALGVATHDATAYGLAFASCHAYAEIVAYDHDDGITTRPPGAVVIYDTGRGRIVAAPNAAPDQRVWSTVTPGTDHRVAQAISALIESLPGGRWMAR
ncbi:hypothetical protein BJY24_001713 [Nocardia transvalensis]|uniref:ESAT-6 protein secretion system EspG family protein n=1 Tax=Nocardia transvalensis TaxID=37333 RepID=A0A7W9PB94_9NOCA|nr:ESX secretion-associated protein EspG [Nocardia transvalensis]MBB5912846.1 hypothetical protein [Nocardia transvalensis]